MKFKLSFLCAVLVLMGTATAGIQWHTDYDHAVKLSQNENKPILLFFNGSDWSGQSMWMKREVLSQPNFESKINKRFVCIEADFPEHSILSNELAAQNQELKSKFHVYELPTLLILNSQERVIAQVGYLPESGEQFAEDLLSLLKQDEQLSIGLSQLPTEVDALKKLYEMAQELGRQDALDQIIDAGLSLGDSFFVLEKYRLLVERGEMKSPQALELREKLSLEDPDNSKGVQFTLALIDFQELSQTHQNPDEAVQPLLSYLERFGSTDSKNVWSIEMMIAQLYMDADLQNKALTHAEKALQFAPEVMREEVAQSLDYIRQTTK